MGERSWVSQGSTHLPRLVPEEGVVSGENLAVENPIVSTRPRAGHGTTDLQGLLQTHVPLLQVLQVWNEKESERVRKDGERSEVSGERVEWRRDKRKDE